MKAVIDIGSTSVRLMVTDGLKPINKKYVNTTKLAEGMSDGFLTAIAIDRTADAVCSFVDTAKGQGAELIYAYATEAVRSAANSQYLLDKVLRVSGVQIDVLSPDLEAKLGFLGAYERGTQAIVDMGGASTEIAVGNKDGLIYGHSLPLGIVRLTNFQRQGQRVEDIIDKKLPEYGVLPKFDEVLAIGGTAGTMVSILNEMTEYDQSKVHHTVLTLKQIDGLYNRLRPMTLEERGNVIGLPQNRAELIPNGVLLWSKVLRYMGADSLTVSERDNMEGYLMAKESKQ